MANLSRGDVIIWAVLTAVLGGPAARQSAAQITFKTIDPRRMELVPLQKPIQPSMPYLPKPRLHQDNIRPNWTQFEPLNQENIKFQNLRPNRIEPYVMPKENMVQQPIAPKWLRRDILGPERLTPEALTPRESFRYQSPIFMPATRPRPGLDESMMLTPSLFSDRPPEGSRPRSSQGKQRGPAAQRPTAQGGRRPLGW